MVRTGTPARSDPRLTARFSPRADWLALLVALIVLAASGWVVGLVVGHPHVDQALVEAVARNRTPGATTAFRVLTRLGGAPALVAVVAVCSLLLWRRARASYAIARLWLALVGSSLLSQSIKHLVGHVRPPQSLQAIHASGFSFPSGHATESIAVWLAVFTIVPLLARGPSRLLARAACVAAVIAVGASRVYLGVHWPTDVLGGWALGGAWLAVVVRCGPSGVSRKP
jgi:undecaprenyl-diphosphatase